MISHRRLDSPFAGAATDDVETLTSQRQCQRRAEIYVIFDQENGCHEVTERTTEIVAPPPGVSPIDN